jgi:hypothetical protein
MESKMKIFNLSIGLAGVCALAAGCTAMNQAASVSDDISHGYVSGLSHTNRFTTIVWSFPSTPPIGPYDKISVLTGYMYGRPTNSYTYVFLLGKSSTNKEWEVFGCTTWTNRHWEYVPVTLPQASSK